MTTAVRELDITSCDQEPIHIPGRIQPHGYLIVCTPETWRVSYHSTNIADIVRVAEPLTGRHLSELIGRRAYHELMNALAASPHPGLPGRTFKLEIASGKVIDAAVHTYAGLTFIELEPALTTYSDATPLFLLRSMLTRLQEAANVEEMFSIAVGQLRALIGFDRVMIYRFLQDGAGSVVAESRDDELPPFLHHHYPASDIPKQARALYLKNWVRLISDVRAQQVEIACSSGSSLNALDMSYCGLRSVSPIHIEYLRNMGVNASLSISIIVGGALWGLIACHHREPKLVPPDVRVAAEFFGQSFSLHLQSMERVDAAEMLSLARDRIDRFLAETPAPASLKACVVPRLAELAMLVPCDGVGLWMGGDWETWGTCPDRSAMLEIAAMLSQRAHGAVFSTHSLSAIHPPARAFEEDVSGLLAIPLSRTPSDYLIMFRREYRRAIEWAGNPNKPVAIDDASERLTPRKSFAIWREQVRGQSRTWEPHDRLTAEALRTALLEVVLRYNSLVDAERAESERRQQLFIAELNHRVKNAMTLIRALVLQSKGKDEDIGTYIAELEGRIRSLARAHDLARGSGALSLHRLLATELEPYASQNSERVRINGPNVAFEDQASATLALVFHEMTTNSVKYGALSQQSGRLDIDWIVDAIGDCVIRWTERGGPATVEPAHQGFGMTLIRKQVPFELGGSSTLNFAPSGLEAEFKIPATLVHLLPDDRSPRQYAQVPSIEPLPLAGATVLVVEDSLVVALEIEKQLRQCGAAKVLLSGTLGEALVHASSAPIDIALLDINLKGTQSYAVADKLAARGIPFAFATGYGNEVKLPNRFGGHAVIAKPWTAAAIAAAVAALLPKRGAKAT